MFAEFTQTKSDKLFFFLFYMQFTTAHIKEMEFDDLHF